MDSKLDLIFKVAALYAKVFKSVDLQLSIHGITFSEFLVMHQLHEAPNQTMRRIDLAAKVGMSASGITRLLSPMEKLKIVQKESNPRDARVSFVKLSNAGEELFKDAKQSVNLSANELFVDLEDVDINHLIAILHKIK